MAVDTAVSPVRASRSNQFPYEVFMEGEGVPVHNAVVGVDDVTKLPLFSVILATPNTLDLKSKEIVSKYKDPRAAYPVK